ncbi:hypothetical protein WAB97_005010 [Stenotrophomonas maltophilia]|uniref:hypothetical protein n=1 Tax=Stenotrophomonas maltophilia group TaxID=995085 RepID=UPI001013D2E4|nr:hypothetical protein [Stenotrophomonas maltophilia]NNH47248.1 hypothetical protein [Stenotrophomonas maltophilia]
MTMVSEMDAFCNTFQHLASLIPMKAIGKRWICDDVRRSRLRDVASQLARTVFPIMRSPSETAPRFSSSPLGAPMHKEPACLKSIATANADPMPSPRFSLTSRRSQSVRSTPDKIQLA